MDMNEKHMPCDVKTEKTLFKIGAFAQMNRVSVKTLRFYETEGLLIPEYIDEENGYRYYTTSQMADIHRILALKECGFTLDDIKRLNKGDNSQAVLNNRRAEILNKIAELTKMLALIDGGVSNTISNPVLIKTLPRVTIAKSTVTLKSYDDLFDEMPRIGEEMEKLGIECTVPEYCFTEYLERGYHEENIKISICQAIQKRKKESDIISYDEYDEQLAACIYHKGSYAKFPESYQTILNYIEDNNYKICGNIREVYIDGVWNKDSEDEWLSEIEIPVKKYK